MQIDGHHALTYVVARHAGLDHAKAEILAYSAQYVDEATNSQPVQFSNGAMFNRNASAHKMLDYRNTNELANHLAWIPFHFLPGNQGLKPESEPDGSFIQRLVCTPDSYVARDMLKAVAQHQTKPFGLHLMGIAMHVYADTFAHQGFAGVIHKINEVNEIDSDVDGSLLSRVKDNFMSWGVSTTSPLGHGAALSFPDRPYANWSYTNGLGQRIERSNTETFMNAANQMYKAIRCYVEYDYDMNIDLQPDLTIEQMAPIEAALHTITDEDGVARHKQWLNLIQKGAFGFEPTLLEFIPHGEGSWKEKARGQGVMVDGEVKYQYSKSFLASDWKMFHDALKTYRVDIIRDVLPKYGICVA
ncbi:DUF6765 family protein [Aeromonas salmonicida]|uniref:DUF6765 family protein n=1 Tax=Aeromonas salmonicida TaxID=645 RepID=UPI001788B3C9|nr:DUF6765 family protein [Aeromonas salmonicida]QOI95895.1 hypothetical protein G7042_23660 [Aeromonas salmonicida subsp. masoucida]